MSNGNNGKVYETLMEYVCDPDNLLDIQNNVHKSKMDLVKYILAIHEYDEDHLKKFLKIVRYSFKLNNIYSEIKDEHDQAQLKHSLKKIVEVTYSKSFVEVLVDIFEDDLILYLNEEDAKNFILNNVISYTYGLPIEKFVAIGNKVISVYKMKDYSDYDLIMEKMAGVITEKMMDETSMNFYEGFSKCYIILQTLDTELKSKIYRRLRKGIIGARMKMESIMVMKDENIDINTNKKYSYLSTVMLDKVAVLYPTDKFSEWIEDNKDDILTSMPILNLAEKFMSKVAVVLLEGYANNVLSRLVYSSFSHMLETYSNELLPIVIRKIQHKRKSVMTFKPVDIVNVIINAICEQDEYFVPDSLLKTDMINIMKENTEADSNLIKKCIKYTLPKSPNTLLGMTHDEPFLKSMVMILNGNIKKKHKIIEGPLYAIFGKIIEGQVEVERTPKTIKEFKSIKYIDDCSMYDILCKIGDNGLNAGTLDISPTQLINLSAMVHTITSVE